MQQRFAADGHALPGGLRLASAPPRPHTSPAGASGDAAAGRGADEGCCAATMPVSEKPSAGPESPARRRSSGAFSTLMFLRRHTTHLDLMRTRQAVEVDVRRARAARRASALQGA
eukprot:365808-Chlamydomonas_euryale.AAC.34